jgi:hypothetical protein
MKNIVLQTLIWVSIPFCFFFSWISLQPSLFSGLIFNESTSHIAGSISGFTSPVFGFLSAILIYYSFKEQFRANELQKDALKTDIKRNNLLKEYDQIISLMDQYVNQTESMEYANSIHYDGIVPEMGFDVVTEYTRCAGSSSAQQMKYVLPKFALALMTFRLFVNKTKEFGKYISSEDKELLDSKNSDKGLLEARIFIEYSKIEDEILFWSIRDNCKLELKNIFKKMDDGSIENLAGVGLQSNIQLILTNCAIIKEYADDVSKRIYPNFTF